MTVPLFEIRGLRARPAEGTDESDPDTLRGIDLVVLPGEVHAIVGPDGSGRSTLAGTLLAGPHDMVTGGELYFQGDEITAWPTDVRAKAGMFLAFQAPQDIPGVSVLQFLRQAASARRDLDLSVTEFRFATTEWTTRLGIDPSLVDRHLDHDVSPIERKVIELLQLAMLRPELAILDEIGSGLDTESLRTVAGALRQIRADRPELSIVLLTCDDRLLTELGVDHVHLLVEGRIARPGRDDQEAIPS